MKLIALGVHNSAEIERAVTEFAAEPSGGLIVVPHAITFANRDILVELAARYRLPAVYAFRNFATSGGSNRVAECLVLGVKRTLLQQTSKSAYDPKQT